MKTDYNFSEKDLEECIDKEKLLRLINYKIQQAITENDYKWSITCKSLESQIQDLMNDIDYMENRLQDYHKYFGDLPYEIIDNKDEDNK